MVVFCGFICNQILCNNAPVWTCPVTDNCYYRWSYNSFKATWDLMVNVNQHSVSLFFIIIYWLHSWAGQSIGWLTNCKVKITITFQVFHTKHKKGIGLQRPTKLPSSWGVISHNNKLVMDTAHKISCKVRIIFL